MQASTTARSASAEARVRAPVQSLVFGRPVLSSIAQGVAASPDLEVAGLGYGHVCDMSAWVEVVNLRAVRPTRYSSDLEWATELAGRRLVCIIHSHPSGLLAPSAHDIQLMRLLPVPWVIGARREDNIEFRAYVCIEDALNIVPIESR
jgi:proteasome lid subunit RPN8/RPN11